MSREGKEVKPILGSYSPKNFTQARTSKGVVACMYVSCRRPMRLHIAGVAARDDA